MDQPFVAAEIRAELGRQNLSHANLASSLGWTEAKLSRRLSGKVAFRLTDVNAIARTLGVKPVQFLNPPKVDDERPIELDLGLPPSDQRRASLWLRRPIGVVPPVAGPGTHWSCRGHARRVPGPVL